MPACFFLVALDILLVVRTTSRAEQHNAIMVNFSTGNTGYKKCGTLCFIEYSLPCKVTVGYGSWEEEWSKLAIRFVPLAVAPDWITKLPLEPAAYAATSTIFEAVQVFTEKADLETTERKVAYGDSCKKGKMDHGWPETRKRSSQRPGQSDLSLINSSLFHFTTLTFTYAGTRDFLLANLRSDERHQRLWAT